MGESSGRERKVGKKGSPRKTLKGGPVWIREEKAAGRVEQSLAGRRQLPRAVPACLRLTPVPDTSR